MPVKIRLARRGRRKRPFYHIIVADSRAPRDGRFIEKLGTYDPLTKPATIELNRDRAYEWLMNGAQPTDTARAILRFKGVLFRKHLMRGVAKGALTEEEAMAKYEAWIAEKEAKIKKRREATAQEKEAFRAAVSGNIPEIKIKEEEPAPAEVTADEVVKSEVESETDGQPSASNDENAPTGEMAADSNKKAEEGAASAETEESEAAVEPTEKSEGDVAGTESTATVGPEAKDVAGEAEADAEAAEAKEDAAEELSAKSDGSGESQDDVKDGDKADSVEDGEVAADQESSAVEEEE